MVEAHPLVLRLRSAGLKDLDPCNIDEVHNMWYAFSKAKLCIDGGDRLEYLSWRIYSREVLAIHASRQSICHPQIDDHDSAVQQQLNSTSDAEQISSSSEEEWETDSESSSIISDSGDSASSNISEAEPKHNIKLRQNATLPQQRPCNTQNPPLESHRRIHRRISSIELQNLFSKSHSSMPTDIQKTNDQVRDQVRPKESRILHNGTTVKSCLKKSSSTSPEPTGSIHRARFASPQPASHREKPKEIPQAESAGVSPVIRGFSPSSVSVSYSLNKPNLDYRIPQSSSDEIEDTINGDTRTIKNVKQPDASLEGSSSNKKMFYIGTAESDTDSSTFGSLDANEEAKQRRYAFPDSKNIGDHHHQNNNNNNNNNDTNKNDSMNQPKNTKDHHTTAIANSNTSDNAIDTDEWDDTSDEEEELDDEATEEKRKEMFKERAVPTKPLLKRSLLSSLFVNKVNDDNINPSPTNNQAVDELSKTPDDHVSAPVDILLGAPLAPHFPLPVDSPMVETSPKDIQQDPAARWHGSSSLDQGPEFSERQRRPSSLRSYSGSLHMTTRPEMYRASTDTRVRRRSSNEHTEFNNWANQHEDIYDPMNYHSRGW